MIFYFKDNLELKVWYDIMNDILPTKVAYIMLLLTFFRTGSLKMNMKTLENLCAIGIIIDNFLQLSISS